MKRVTLVKTSLLSIALGTLVLSSTAMADAKATYKDACAVCHTAGIAGAPKLGDKTAWASRIAAGNDTLYTTAIKGKGAMPAKGGRAELSDDDVKAIVDYMVEQSK